ncbi:MAG: Spx/MgsR family RNA polymerase-binding regulatory protein, partial [Leptospirales bacterium]
FYGYNKCATSRKGEKVLVAKKIEYKFIDVTLKPPAKSALKKIIQQSGEPIKKFFNTAGIAYKEGNIKDKIKEMTDAQMIELLASDGRLLKRPVVTDGEISTVGFKEEVFQKTWKKKRKTAA